MAKSIAEVTEVQKILEGIAGDPYAKFLKRKARGYERRGLNEGEVNVLVETFDDDYSVKLHLGDATAYRFLLRDHIFGTQERESYANYQGKLTKRGLSKPEDAYEWLTHFPIPVVVLNNVPEELTKPAFRESGENKPSVIIACLDNHHEVRHVGINTVPVAFFTLEQVAAGIQGGIHTARRSQLISPADVSRSMMSQVITTLENFERFGLPAQKMPKVLSGAQNFQEVIGTLPPFTYRGPKPTRTGR